MKVAVCVVIASLFVNTVKAVESKQVNLALETVLNFDKKDRAADLAVIDKVQNFLEQIKNGMRRGNSRRSTNYEIKLTDFILEAAEILKKYDDTDLEDAYVIINDESRKYINKGSELQELFQTQELRRFVSDQLDDARDMSADALRRSLDAVIGYIQIQKKSGEKNELLNIGNSVYDGASDKFLKALRDLDKLRRTSEINLERVLRNTLKALVFDHYSNLDYNVRDELVNMVKHYWRAFADKINSKHVKSKLKTVDVTPYRHESKGKHHNRHRSNYQTERPHLNKSKPFKTHQNYKSIEIEIKDKQEDFLTDHELTKFMNNQEAAAEKPKSRFSVFADKIKPHSNGNPLRDRFKAGRSKSSPQLVNKPRRIEDRREKQHEFTESSEPEILMGGQTIRDIHFRGSESGSKELSASSDRAEGDTSTEEIVIQHNNIVDIGLSRKTPGRINITFISSEKRQTDDFKESASKESMSIERTNMRKSNVMDTLETPYANNLSNVNILIQNIEKQIKYVKDQVEYVKNLTKTTSRDYKEAKSTDIKEPEIATESTKNVTVAMTTETNGGFAFRAQDDSDFNDDYPEENVPIKEITEITSTITTASDANVINESKNDTESTSETVHFTDMTNPKSLEADDKSTTHEVSKSDDIKNVTNTTNDDSLHAKDDEHNGDDQENAITESSFVSTASMLVDIKINA